MQPTYLLRSIASVLLLVALTLVGPAFAATVSWTGGNGDWNTLTNWSSGALPGPNDDVMIDLPGNLTITHSSGTHSVKSLVCREAITLSGGSLSVSNASQFTNSLTLSGGTLTGTGAVTITGTLDWSSGRMEGSGRTIIASGATATMSGTQAKYLTRTLENAGTVNYTGNQLYFGYAAASPTTISNRLGGVFNVIGEGDFAYNNPAAHIFHNAGTLNKSGAGTTTSFSGVAFYNSGTINVDSGTLTLPGGTIIDSGSTLAGTGTLEFGGGLHSFTGNATITGRLVTDSATLVFNSAQSLASLTLNGGGVLTGVGDVTITGTLDWSSGRMEGSGRTIIASGATATLSAGQKFLTRTLENAGTVDYTGNQLYFGYTPNSSATISNRAGGVFNVSGGPSFYQNYSGDHVFLNAGTFNKTGAGTTTFSGVAFHNSGTVNVASGTLDMSSGGGSTGPVNVAAGGTLNLNGNFGFGGGGTLAGAGTVNFNSGTYTFAGNFSLTSPLVVSSSTLVFNSAQSLASLTLNGGGVLTGVGDVTITGTLDWSSGRMEGSGRTIIASGATATLSAGQKFLTRTLENAGTMNSTNSLLYFGYTVGSSTILSNRAGGVFNASGGANFYQYNPSTNFFHNAGTFNKTGAGTTTSFSGVAFHNSGTVNVASGMLTFDRFRQTGGELQLAGGALGASTPMELLGGILAGTNSISGSVTNSAVIRPGPAGGDEPGRLLITGNYTQTDDGTLDIQLAGLLPNTQHDTLAVSGTATLGGTVDVSFLGGFTPAAGNEFNVLAAGTRSGNFTQFNTPGGEPQLQLLHTNNLVLLRAVNGPPAYPDLRVAALNITAPTLAAGQTITIAWRDTNAGNALIASGWSDQITISNATTRVTLLNTTLAYHPITEGPLVARGFVPRSTTFRLPDGTNGAGSLVVSVRTDSLNQLFEFGDGFNAETNNFAELTVVSASTDYPDLVVTNISGPLTGLPGQSVPVVWTVRNLGPATAATSWGEYIFLSDDAVVGNDSYVGGLTITGPLAAGASITRTQLVTLPSLGTGAKRFLVTVDAHQSVFELNETNNSATAAQTLTLPTALTLHLTSAIYEDTASVSGSVVRNDPDTNALVVSLTSSAPARATVPATITIPAGQHSAGFTVVLTGDALALGDLPVLISASAANHTGATNLLTILENDVAHLSLQLGASVIAENAGSGTLAASITRNAFTNTPLIVSLTSSRPDALAVPATVTIPTGALAVFFNCSPVDNTILDGTRDVYLQATAPNLNATSAHLEVTDDETVVLALVFTDSTVAEGGPSPATIGTVTRSPVAASALTLSLTASNGAWLEFPHTLTIAAGEASASFAVNVGDDTQADSPRVAHLTATAQAANGGLIASSAIRVPLTLLDNDGPTLELTLAATTIAESGGTTATVRRNTPATNALVVTLASDRTGEATVPANVTIPLNSASATFAVTGVADGTPDGVKTVNLSASAAGFNAAVAQLNVTDIDLPDLLPTAIAPVSSNAITESVLEISWNVANRGLAAAAGDWVDRVYLSRSPYRDASTVLLTSFTNSGLLTVDASYARTRSVTMPENPGNYWLLVETDTENSFNEASERNNALAAEQALAVQPAYRAEVFTDITVTTNGAVIPLHGRTFLTADGTPAPSRPASVHIWVNGVRRVLDVMSDGSGNFTAAFAPLPTEAGRYFIGADHPRINQVSTNDTFVIVGMKAEPRSLDLVLVQNEARLGSFEIRNLSQEPLTGLTVTPINLPSGVFATTTTSNTLAGAGTNLVSFSFTTTLTNAESFEGGLRVTSAEGAVTEVAVRIEVRFLRPQLVANPGSLVRGMVRGVQSMVSFEVANLGGAPSGDLQVLLPGNTPWMSLASAADIPSLAPGAKSVVTLRLSPAADQPLVLYQGALAVVGASSGVNMPFQFRSLSEARGDLLVSVTDELTYFTVEAPRVTNATVIVRDGYTTEVIASGLSDSNGQVSLPNLPEGDYVLEASAAKHASYRGRVSIVPGVMTEKETFLSKQTVTYRWTVVPAEIADHYKVVLESTFETEVPAPVLVVENPRIMPLLFGNEPQQIEFRLRNEGLIAFQDVQLVVPEHPEYIITPLTRSIGVLPAKSRVVIPATIQRRSSGEPVLVEASGGSFCGLGVEAIGFYICGPNGVPKTASVSITPIQADVDSANCIKDSIEGIEGGFADVKRLRDVLGNFFDAGCDLARSAADCLEDPENKPHPCTKLALDGVCKGASGFLTGGQAGAAAGIGGAILDNMECVCNIANAVCGSCGSGGKRGGGGSGSGSGPWVTYGDGNGGGGFGFDCGGGASSVSAGIRAAAGPEGVCARVRIRIEQEAVLTRTAFRGTLEMDNDGGTPLAGLQLTLDIRDGDNLPAGDRFVTTGPVLGGQFSSLDGNGVLPAAASGSAVYTFIPTREAAPTQPKIYKIGGTLRYLDNGLEVVVPLLTAPITVYPEARLVLDYFQQRDVYSDDPFTAEVEPAEPFALGLIVKNTGAGEAFDFRITSAQPQIIENEKGLLIDFKIIGTQVGSEEVTPSLTASLGDIPPAGAKAARWLFESSLQGKFIDYTASFEHIDSLGSENLSIIDQVSIHELIHVVRDDRPGADAEPDFLVNDLPDANDLPDTLYFSTGAQEPVTIAGNVVADAPATLSDRIVQLTVSMTSGWNYLSLPDPGPGLRLERVVRSDGKQLRVGDNAWQTDRSFPNSVIGSLREHLLHLLDHNGTGSYTLHYGVDDRSAPQIVSILGPAENPVPAAVTSVDVVFSEAIDSGTFTRDDLTLTRNGDANLIDGGISLAPVNETTWRVSGLASITGADGNYELTVLGASIRDFGSNFVTGSVSTSWAKGTAVPVVVQVGPIAPNPRSTAVTTVDTLFSLPVNPATFTREDLTLTHNGGANLVNAGVNLVTISPTTFRITGLGALTGVEGVFRLAVNAETIAGTNGVGGLGGLSVTWTNDASGPTIVDLEQVRTSPRNIVVPSLEVMFSEVILPASFTRDDVTLTRDGGPNLVTAEVNVAQVSPFVWRVSGINWNSGQPGAYTFTVNATGIADLAGNPGSGSLARSWNMDTERPGSVSGLAVTPDSGVSATDRLINTNRPVLMGSVAESNVTVRVFDSTSNRDLGSAASVGLSFTQPLQLDPGARRLRVFTVDVAGNVSSNVFLDVFVDLTAPALSLVTITPELQTTNVSFIDVLSTEPIDPATFTTAAMTLTRNGGSNLIAGAVSIVPVTTNSYRVTGLDALNASVGHYVFVLDAGLLRDRAGNPGSGQLTNRWSRTTGNAAPILAAIPDATLVEGAIFQFTAQASDADDGDTLTFSMTGAPPGAQLNPQTGAFRYHPDELAGPRTNQVTFTIADNGIPQRTASRSFRMVVRNTQPDFSISLGSTNLFAGESNALPIVLVSGVSLTNVVLRLDAPPGYLHGLGLKSLVPDLVSAELVAVGGAQHELRLGFDPTQIQNGVRRVGELAFGTGTNDPSAYVRLPLIRPVGRRLTGQVLTQASAVGGRVIIVNGQPVLEALHGMELDVYGHPGTTFHLESTGAFPPQWSPVTTISLTNRHGHRVILPPLGSGNRYLRLRE